MVSKRRQVYTLHSCEVCARGFRSARKHARTCSPRCRQALKRAGQSKAKSAKKQIAKTVTGVTLSQLDFLLEKYSDDQSSDRT